MMHPFIFIVRRNVLAGLIVILLALLAACEDTPPASEAVVDAATTPVADSSTTTGGAPAPSILPTATPTPTPLAGRIVLWHSWAEGDGDALAAILAAYQQAEPGVIVDTLFVAYPDLAQAYATPSPGAAAPT
jgi:arabinogalactan oligomer/maltooligosaccharide transport system substrate-binding protein